MMNILQLPLRLLVLLYQSAVLALSQILTNKMRSFLTTIGIVIGIASVTAVIAALTGLRANVEEGFSNIGTNKIWVYPDTPNTGGQRRFNRKQFYFPKDIIEGILEHCPSLKAATRTLRMSGPVQFGDRSEPTVPINGIDPDWHIIENRFVTLGRTFSLIDNLEGSAVCLINEQLRQKLGLPFDCIGEAILVQGRRFTIVGLVETRVDAGMFGEQQTGSEVFVPFKVFYRDTGMYMEIVLMSKSAEVSEEAQAEVKFFLRQKRHIQLGQPDNFGVRAMQQMLDEFSKVFTGITAVASGVVSISLLVGGIGIMNIMLVSVSERTREIGLRKAVGARPAAILLQFLVEAVMLCCVGGLFGILGGQGLTSIIAHIPGAKLDKAQIPGWAIALSFGFSASIGLIFGMFPAIKASRLDPIEALRHE